MREHVRERAFCQLSVVTDATSALLSIWPPYHFPTSYSPPLPPPRLSHGFRHEGSRLQHLHMAREMQISKSWEQESCWLAARLTGLPLCVSVVVAKAWAQVMQSFTLHVPAGRGRQKERGWFLILSGAAYILHRRFQLYQSVFIQTLCHFNTCLRHTVL